jgi:hypothetical protein
MGETLSRKKKNHDRDDNDTAADPEQAAEESCECTG